MNLVLMKAQSNIHQPSIKMSELIACLCKEECSTKVVRAASTEGDTTVFFSPFSSQDVI